MTEFDYARKLAEVDRLLNDPEVPMRPSEVWALLAEIARHDDPSKQGQGSALDPPGNSFPGPI